MDLLVVTDFSKQSKKAVRFAMDMAHAQQAKITLLFTYLPVYGFSVQVAAYEDMVVKKAKKWLKKIQRRGLKRGIVTGFKIRKGNLKKFILQEISKYPYDLIILTIPMQKRTRFFLLPGEKEDLVNSIPSPILVLPANCRFSSLKRIAVIINKPGRNLTSWEQLIELTGKFRLPYQILYFSKKEKSGMSTPSSQFLDHLKHKFPLQQFTWKVEKGPQSEQGIVSLTTRKPKTLLTFFTKTKPSIFSFFTFSKAAKMTISTQIPLLVLKY